MRLLYTFGIRCYALGVRVASCRGGKARLMVRGWHEAFERLAAAPAAQGPTVWFHASSLGEFEQARPVLELFRQQHPRCRICVTFFSPSGYEVRKDYPLADLVCYLPIDTPANARRFVDLMNPSVAFFAKYDFWFNYLEQLRQRRVPTFLFSAIFRPGQYFFKPWGRWYLRQVGRCFTHLFVQDAQSVRLLTSRHITQVSLAGDTRFDRVYAIAQEARPFAAVEQFLRRREGSPVLLAGSTWPPDEALLKQYLDHHGAGLTLVLAPHVTDPGHIDQILDLFGPDRCARLSRLPAAPADASVLIIDSVGILASLYQYAYVAYIGGGFGRGIHNILEAVTFGKPVLFGPNYGKFKEACDLVALGGGFTFSHYPQLQQTLDQLLSLPDHYQAASQVCTQYLADNLGSSQKILRQVQKHLPLADTAQSQPPKDSAN